MESKTKKRISVEIAGSTLTLVTDENEDFVRDAADQLDNRIRELTRSSFRISTLDAALLCAVDHFVNRSRAEKRIRSLEEQLSLSESNARSLERSYQEQLDALRAELHAANDDSAPSPAGEETILTPDKAPDLKQKEISAAREEKIRCIESLLRGSRESIAP